MLKQKYLISAVFSIAILSADDGANRPRGIASITVCNSDPTGAFTQSCGAAYDTERMVLAPGFPPESINQAGFGTATDEHSTVFPPGHLGGNGDYMFFVATGFLGVNPDIGLMVLSSHGADDHGQWTIQPATDQAYGNYAAGPGQVFLSPMKPTVCPDVPGQNTTDPQVQQQDQTFDLNYAVPGSVFQDPTSGRLLMVYEGNNDCVGAPGGPKPGGDSYQTIGVATSLDAGRTWPQYASNGLYTPAELPFANPVSPATRYGPQQPFGAMGPAVCMGNTCAPNVPATYGRYEVLSPSINLNTFMQGMVLQNSFGHSEPSAFVDDVQPGNRGSGNPPPYVYIVTHYLSDDLSPLLPYSNGRKDDLSVARAKLDPSGAPLQFSKWNGASFPVVSNGLTGTDSSMLSNASDGNFRACGDNASTQGRSAGSISFVEDTGQYLLLFVCTSPGDPIRGAPTPKAFGSAWFYSTTDNLNDQSSWSIPKEIEGSYADHTQFKNTTGCMVYNGWYPTMMSLNKSPGHLSTQGYVFYLTGSLGACNGGGLPPRTYSSRQFTIVTARR
jgi:hypothetical protein